MPYASIRNALAHESDWQEELSHIRAQAIHAHAMRSPAISVVALLECLSDVSIRINLQGKGAN